ncbi:SDR family oxidoreductase [Membranihabitans marinus]
MLDIVQELYFYFNNPIKKRILATMTKFKDKTAIITGAAIGIGFEIARQLAQKGCHIVLNDIDENAAHIAANEIRTLGGQCMVVSGNSCEMEVIDEMISVAETNFGQLDYAIANAGITTFGDFLTYSPEKFQQLMAVNLQGSFFLAQKAAQSMIKNNVSGRIVFMSSVTGHQAHQDLTAYGMTKAALRHLGKTLAVELGPHHITVNAVSPGATMTERTQELDKDFQEQWERITPTGKVAYTTDIAHAVLFLLSPLSSQITGQTIVVDGGWTSYSPQPQ